MYIVAREEECVGCDLCSQVCPVDACITIEEIYTGRPQITWNKLVTEKPEVLEWDKMEEYRKAVGIEIH